MPEFSVLLPTRHRYASARLALRTILSAVDDNTEVVIGDNGDQPLDVGPFDPRVRILRAETTLSMPENWERVIRAARGKWLVLLSNKCRLIPGALQLLRDYGGEKYSVVTYQRTSFFQDLPTDQFDSLSSLADSPGNLTHTASSHAPTAMSSAATLREWYLNADYSERRPMLYTALIRRDLVERVLKRSPSFFVGMAPDVGSGLRILSESETFLSTTVPATMIHYPTSRTWEWSTGMSFTWGRGSKSFLSEFRIDHLAGHALPPTATAIVFETLLDFQNAASDRLPPDIVVGWTNFARAAAHEIERFPKEDRLRLQLALFNALLRGQHDAAAAVVQLKSVLVSRMPSLYEVYARIRDELTRRVTPKSVPISDLQSSPCASMDDAIGRLAREVHQLRTVAPQNELSAAHTA